jgi:hypothetical protein
MAAVRSVVVAASLCNLGPLQLLHLLSTPPSLCIPWPSSALQVLATCSAKGIAAGVFCLGQQRAAHFAAQGYKYVAYDVDLNILIQYSAETTAALRNSH